MRNIQNINIRYGSGVPVPVTLVSNKIRMKTMITKEEALRRLKATKQIKKERIEVLRKRMCEKYEANMGCTPQNILFL